MKGETEKLCGVIRVDPELEKYIIERAKTTRLSKVGVIRTWADADKARAKTDEAETNPTVDGVSQKRVVAVQGTDGVLRTDPSFR